LLFFTDLDGFTRLLADLQISDNVDAARRLFNALTLSRSHGGRIFLFYSSGLVD